MLHKSTKKIMIFITVLLLIVVTTLESLPHSVYADTLKDAQKLEKSLESKYSITISISKGLSKNVVETIQALNSLDHSLSLLPKNLLSSLIKHHKSKGRATTFSFLYSSATAIDTPAAIYFYTTNTINLYLPESGASLWGSGQTQVQSYMKLDICYIMLFMILMVKRN